jgi:putative intracellular protease/amidase
MKRLTIPLLAMLAGVALLEPVPAHGQGARVLLVVTEGGSEDLAYTLPREVGVMTELLKQAGFGVAVATASGKPLVAGETTVTPDLKFSEVKVSEYAGVVFPCLAAADSVRSLPPRLSAMIREAAAKGTPIAAQAGGILTLATTEALAGKKYAFVEQYKDAVASIPSFRESIYAGGGMVQDGNIITSAVCPQAARMFNLPDGTPGLIQALIAQMRSRG